MRTPSGSALSLAALVFFGLCWGAGLPLTKHATSTGLHPAGLLTWQMSIAAAVLGVIVRWRRIPVPLDALHLRWYAFIAATGTLVPNTFSLLAYRHLPAAIMALIIATVPVFTLVVAILLGAERADARRIAGVLLGVSALALVAVPEASLPGRHVLPWVAVGLLAPLCYAIEANTVAARVPATLSPVAALFGASVIGAAIAGTVAASSGVLVDPFASWTSVEWALAASGLCNVVAYTGYLWLIRRAGAVFTSQVGYVVTLTGVAAGVVFLGERPALTVLAAVPLMLAGVMLVQPRKRDVDAVPEPDEGGCAASTVGAGDGSGSATLPERVRARVT